MELKKRIKDGFEVLRENVEDSFYNEDITKEEEGYIDAVLVMALNVIKDYLKDKK
jgi:hypothetical protein